MSTLAFSTSTFNITIPVPEGTSDHGDPSILCTPTNWTSILSFFIGNYIAHAATTLSSPGEELFEYAQTVAMALLFPSAGVERGLDAIFRCAVSAKSDLMRAARAGALCTVIRTKEWKSDPTDPLVRRHGQYLDRVTHKHLPYWRFRDAPCEWRKIHGVVKTLPPGYKFEVVPRDAVVNPTKNPAGADAQSVVICTSQQTAKVVVAIWKTLYGAATLYHARGDQLARYGYAAFALTVTPYTVMSIVNLLGALLTPSYPTMYLVRSEVMDELDRRTSGPEPYFYGTVGFFGTGRRGIGRGGIERAQEELGEEEQQAPPSMGWLSLFQLLPNPPINIPVSIPDMPQFYIVLAVAGGIPLAIIGGLTKFRQGDSTLSQRVWLMMWLALGCVGAIFARLRIDMAQYSSKRLLTTVFLFYHVVYAAPAIGGMVVVGKMIKGYGDCIRLD
ncbi:hypothetical protein MSAN_00825700 [Mycena sanguinolenta]|uniref:Uncharacterized protein n=1 Tax=Mycena sanguinolenta TaxID=230812 RepID=A0A8H6YYN8_9AGAR|nr:hypothetical protein MSAN_00825700 [Mycena sanguinolenta]